MSRIWLTQTISIFEIFCPNYCGMTLVSKEFTGVTKKMTVCNATCPLFKHGKVTFISKVCTNVVNNLYKFIDSTEGLRVLIGDSELLHVAT